MHDLVLFLGIVGGLGITVAYPYVGALLWAWFTLQQPHQLAYGVVTEVPLNYVIAVVTLVAWFLSQERKIPPAGFIFWMSTIFVLWMAITTFFAFDPVQSWPYWNLTWKTFLLGFLIAAMATSRTRIDALIWIVVISLFYYGVKGGLFTILTGGGSMVFGPEGSTIADNNQLALALLMVLPFAIYLRGQVSDKRISYFLIAGIGLTVIAVVGSYSRGGLIGLGALGLFILLRVRNRFLYLAIASVLLVFVLNFMPEQFFQRVDTISTATISTSTPNVDNPIEGRVYSWRVAFLYASDHFPLGAGFYGPQLGALYHQYFPDRVPLAAHSIYFQVLGEHGFIGLAMYLAILAAAFITCSRIISVTREIPDRQWAHDLAVSIQASLFVFCVAGAALSLAYYDLFIIDIALLLPLRELVLLERKQKRQAWKHPLASVSQEI